MSHQPSVPYQLSITENERCASSIMQNISFYQSQGRVTPYSFRTLASLRQYFPGLLAPSDPREHKIYTRFLRRYPIVAITEYLRTLDT